MKPTVLWTLMRFRPLAGNGLGNKCATFIKSATATSFRPLAGNGLGKLNRVIHHLMKGEFPSPCGE